MIIETLASFRIPAQTVESIDLLEEQGIVGPDEGPTKGRAVLVPAEAEPPAPPTEPKLPARDTDEGDHFADFTEQDWKDLDK